MRFFVLQALLITLYSNALVACGEAPPPVPEAPVASAAPDPATSPSASPPEEKGGAGLPTACADKGGKLCVPPASFVKRLCAGFFPDVALVLMNKDAPWTKAYVRVSGADAVNASGGVSSNDKLLFEEEVVVVAHRDASLGGMTVSGAGDSYDVLRWDGTCATLSGEEIGFQPPSKPKYARIPWKNLDDAVRDALLRDGKIANAYAVRRKECKGATMGEVSLKCVKADDLLSAILVEYVRSGGMVPAPAKLP